MAMKHLDGFVVVPEEMYAKLTEKRAHRTPPRDLSSLTADDVVEALPASLRERGTRLVHLLRTVMEWNRHGEIVNRYTDTPIPGSNVVNAVRYLLGDERVDDPAKRYVVEVAHDTHILPAIGEEEEEMEEEEEEEEEDEDPNDLFPLHLESKKTEKKSPVENKKTEKNKKKSTP